MQTSMQTNDSYLDKTANKWPRAAADKIEFVVWHETGSPKPDNPYGTLDYNLTKKVGTSYHYLIARDGTIFHYINEKQWIAYHAGVNSSARGYSGWYVNVHSLGVEVDGANNGTPITAAQQRAIATLMVYFKQSYGIPIDRAYHLGHKEVAPGYKSDPQGYRIDDMLALAAQAGRPPLADVTVIGAAPACTLSQFQGSLQRHNAPLSTVEQLRIYQMLGWYQVEPSFLIALWKHEGGTPLGSSPLQQATHCPLNLRAAEGEWRPTVERGGIKWLAYESFQIGCMEAVLHLKNVYGARQLLTVRQILPVFAPASDANDVESYIKSALEDMQYIRAH